MPISISTCAQKFFFIIITAVLIMFLADAGYAAYLLATPGFNEMAGQSGITDLLDIYKRAAREGII